MEDKDATIMAYGRAMQEYYGKMLEYKDALDRIHYMVNEALGGDIPDAETGVEQLVDEVDELRNPRPW